MLQRRLFFHSVFAPLLLWGLVGVPRIARAQNVDLPRLDPSPAGDRFFGVPSPYAAGELTPHGGFVVDYAHDPLVLEGPDGEAAGAVVEHQMFIHADLSLAIVDHILLNVDMPFALVNTGDGPVAGDGLVLTSPHGPGFGDLRTGVRVRLYGEYDEPFQIALGGYAWFPTGTNGAYITNATVRGQPQALLGGSVDRFVWTMMVGATLKGVDFSDDVALGHQFAWGAGFGGLVGPAESVQLGIETSGAMTLQDPSGRNTHIEALAGIKWRVLRFIELGGGAGAGLTRGIGTPDVRGVFSFMYTPDADERPPYVGPNPADHDRDRIADDVDACPDDAGVPRNDPQKHGCPVRDRDNDGLADDLDACPDRPGGASGAREENGCPLGNRPNDPIVDGVVLHESGVPNE
ncbi:MAG: hypothetical protein HOW73_12320 [Polyangiaceae bacterium]|nr:hypothetical protein [Polyangiaceae bacterium]